MQRVTSRLTYANVMATVAIFIALGGASYAAIKLPKNSVGAKQLKQGAVTEAKIKNGAITAAKLRRGTVPKAVHAVSADSATQLQGQTAAQIVAAAKVKCPAGTVPAGGVCFDATQRTPATLVDAYKTCGDLGLMLPAPSQLAAFLSAAKVNETDWADSLSSESSFPRGATLNWSSYGLSLGTVVYSSAQGYRCASLPTN